MPRSLLLIVSALGVLSTLAPVSGGQTWDFAADYSVDSGNPNGAWAYGFKYAGSESFTLFTSSGAVASGLEYWMMPDETLGGNIIRNPTASDIRSGSTFCPAHEGMMHPGQANPSCVRWTAPSDMWVSIQGYFRQEAGGDCDTHVVRNGVYLADGVVSGFYGSPPGYTDRDGNPEWTFALMEHVSPGDLVDFMLGVGPDSSWTSGTTALKAVITDITDQLGTVSGHVRLDAEGNPPAPGVDVSVVGTAISTTTDADGYYQIRLLTGDYTLKMSKFGYATQSLPVDVPASGTVTCDAILSGVPPVTVMRIGEIRGLPENTPVTISVAKVVTASSGTFTDGSCYIEDADRAAGIRIAPAAGSVPLAEGDRVTLTGILVISGDGERLLEEAVISTKSSGSALKPLGLANKSVQAPIGLEPTGLLVRVWGTVAYRVSDGSCIYIDDGSKCSNGTGNPIGLKVLFDGLVTPMSPVPEPGQYVTVSGLVGCSGGERVVRPRSAADITAIQASGPDMALAQQWFAAYLGQSASQFPFSFTYNGASSTALLPTWTHTVSTTNLDSVRTQVTHTYTAPAGLQVRCVGVIYNDYPIVEWTVYIKNTGTTNTQIWQNVQALDAQFTRNSQAEFILHRAVGSPCQANDYQPIDDVMPPGSSVSLAAGGGRSTNANLCYFNFESAGKGCIVALGWPGQWSASFTRDSGSSMRVVAGQELTNFRLYPGEEVRTPLVALQFFSSGQVNAQNTWRRWMLEHNMPRTNGELIPPQFGGCFGNLQPYAEQELAAIQGYYDDGIEFDYYDLDAGWYPDNGSWPNVGTWEVDYSRFPDGLKPISDLLHAHNTKFILWFEPERVVAGTWLAVNHPEWCFGSDTTRLFNMGDATARNWMIDRCSSLITSEGVDWFRNDYNLNPLGFWRGADASDRQGIAENFYVQGFLEFWDELLRRHPNLWIDTCASGGRRNDLEVLRRAVPLLRSDAWGYNNSQAITEQCHNYGISYWMPCNGTGAALDSIYLQRSAYNPLHRIAYDPLAGGNLTLFMKAFNETKQIMPYWYGDYYPLTPYSLSADTWMGWQFNSPELGGGFFQAFRREASTTASMQLRLSGLEPQSNYLLKNLDDNSTQTITGQALMSGFTVSIATQPGSAIYLYTKVQ